MSSKKEAFSLRTVEEVRSFIKSNSSKQNDDSSFIDPENFHKVNSCINFNIFIVDDMIYTREELFKLYPLEKLQSTPEQLFNQQDIFVIEEKGGGEPDYYLRDSDDTSEFRSVRGLKATKTIRSRIYIAKEKWKSLEFLKNFTASMMTFKPTRQIMSKMFSGLLLEDKTDSAQKMKRENSDSIDREENRKEYKDYKEDITDTFVLPMDLRTKADLTVSDVKEDTIKTKSTVVSGLENKLLLIIYPTDYTLYPKVDVITEINNGDTGFDIPCPKDLKIPSFLETDGKSQEVNLEMKACLIWIDGNGNHTCIGYDLRPRSGTGKKTPLIMANSIGTFDEGYRGNHLAFVHNLSSKPYEVKQGTALFQITHNMPLSRLHYVVVNEKSNLFPIWAKQTTRGSGGFGSTGLSGNTQQSGKN